MSVPVQPANPSVGRTFTPSEGIPDGTSFIEAKKSLATGEETIRNAVNKWFGPLIPSDPSARAGKNEHHETILDALLRLHAISCGLVAEEQRLALPEQDILSTIQILNYIAITLHCPPKVIASRCAIRSLREQNLRANQLDPLQLRHLLTFRPDLEKTGKDIYTVEALKLACEKTDFTSIHTWFETTVRTKAILPRDTPQLLRQMAIDLWDEGHRDVFETFVTELAVLDASMFDIPGWENTRQFFAIFKRVHGSACHFAASFLKSEDIALAIALYQQLGDPVQTAHFHELARTHDASAFRHFEFTILAAAKDQGSRNPFETSSASPFATQQPFDVLRSMALRRSSYAANCERASVTAAKVETRDQTVP
jgi:hypothetical protein